MPHPGHHPATPTMKGFPTYSLLVKVFSECVPKVCWNNLRNIEKTSKACPWRSNHPTFLIGVYNHLRKARYKFRFHETILSFGDRIPIGCGIWTLKKLTSWWNQPSWTIWSSKWESSPIFGVKIKDVWTQLCLGSIYIFMLILQSQIFVWKERKCGFPT